MHYWVINLFILGDSYLGYCVNLIETWLAAGKDAGFKTNTAILESMNDDLGIEITNNRIYEWKNGKQRPPVVVTNYMLTTCILYALKQIKPRIKLTSGEQLLLCEMLSIPGTERK